VAQTVGKSGCEGRNKRSLPTQGEKAAQAVKTTSHMTQGKGAAVGKDISLVSGFLDSDTAKNTTSIHQPLNQHCTTPRCLLRTKMQTSLSNLLTCRSHNDYN
jgi:hypothetical protein